MQARSITLFVFCFLLVFFDSVSLRKFDIEAECLKLYKEDLKTVLHRFRRTSDYLKILMEREQNLLLHFADIKTYTLNYYQNKLVQDAKKMFVVDEDMNTTKPGELEDLGQCPATEETTGRLLRRSGDPDTAENMTTPSGVEILDRYSMLTPELTVQEKNALKDMAFDYTRDFIRAVINHVGPDDPRGMSTQLSADEEGKSTKHFSKIETKTTTEHVRDVSEGLRLGPRKAHDKMMTGYRTKLVSVISTPQYGY